jgi:hypothetical protein
MDLSLDVALREIYFNVNGGYMSMEKLYQSAKEEGIKGVSRKMLRNGYRHKIPTSSINRPENITRPKEPMWTDLDSKFKWTLWI